MTKRYAQLFSLAGMLLLVLSVAGLARLNSPAQTVKSAELSTDAALTELANYRQWTRVNQKPRPSNRFQIDGADA